MGTVRQVASLAFLIRPRGLELDSRRPAIIRAMDRCVLDSLPPELLERVCSARPSRADLLAFAEAYPRAAGVAELAASRLAPPEMPAIPEMPKMPALPWCGSAVHTANYGVWDVQFARWLEATRGPSLVDLVREQIRARARALADRPPYRQPAAGAGTTLGQPSC